MKRLNVSERDDESHALTSGPHKVHDGEQNVSRSSWQKLAVVAFFQKAFRCFNQIEVFGMIEPNRMFVLPPRNHA